MDARATRRDDYDQDIAGDIDAPLRRHAQCGRATWDVFVTSEFWLQESYKPRVRSESSYSQGKIALLLEVTSDWHDHGSGKEVGEVYLRRSHNIRHLQRHYQPDRTTNTVRSFSPKSCLYTTSMAPNHSFVFNSVPTGLPVVGTHVSVQPAAYDSEAACPDGGVFVQSLYASIDPYHRARMRHANVPSYQPALEVGSPLVARSIAKVLRSKNDRFQSGDLVVGNLPIQEYTAVEKGSMVFLKPLDASKTPDVRVHLSALGVPGLTAYGGLYEIGKPAKGQTIFVSAASGAVGQMVGQLAKMEGMRVIGSVGSDEKLEYITSDLGFDAGFNYKQEQPADALARIAPEGIDVYFDNVGAEHLDAALGAMKDFGRVVMCGTIAGYNTAREDQYPLRSYSLIFSKRLSVRGFIVSDKDIAPKYAQEHQARVQQYLADGSIQVKLWEVEGIENAPDAFLALFTGGNFGKAVLKF